MAGIITVNRDLPTDQADIFGGTPLESIPGPGVLLVYVASSQRDGVLSIGGPAVLGGAFDVPPVLRASGIPDVNADIPTAVPVQAGKVMASYDEVTAGDAFCTAIYIGA